MKKVAILVTSLNSGGAERIAGLLSKELANRYEVYVFVLDDRNIVYEYGGTLVPLGDLNPFFEISVAYYKRKYQIDVAISFLEVMNFANIRSRGSERVIISERCVHSRMQERLYNEELLMQRLYGEADEIVTCAYGVQYELERIYGIKNKMTTIYNFLNQKKIREDMTQEMAAPIAAFVREAPYFICVGRLHEQKNHEAVIESFAAYRRAGGNICRLLILGDGDLRQPLQQKIDLYGLQDEISIFPYTKNPFRYMHHAKALICASRYEGLPNVILEAFVCECPVIAADCLSGPRELLDDRTAYDETVAEITICKRGILIPADCNGLSDAMRLAEDEGLCGRLVADGQDYLHAYSNEVILRQWSEAIERDTDSDVAKQRPNEWWLLDTAEHIAIYGAGGAAKVCYQQLSKQYHIEQFLVSDRDKAGGKLFGIPIKYAAELAEEKEKWTVVLGLGYQYQDAVVGLLQSYGIGRIVYPMIDLSYGDFIKGRKLVNQKTGKVVLFGVTLIGMLLAEEYIREGKTVLFMDNDREKQGKAVMRDILCEAPYREEDDCVYIISANNNMAQKNIYDQLEGMGVSLIVCLSEKERQYIIEQADDRIYIERQYRMEVGCEIDLKQPKGFNEKLNWLKLYDRNPIHTIMVDKYAVKQFVADKIGAQYVIPVLGVWDSFDEIDFSALPEQFVLKCTHDSGSVVVCKDKREFEREIVRERFGKALKNNYFYPYREWPYKNVMPRILAEKYMQDTEQESLIVYKFFCFNGKPKIIQVIQNDKTPKESIDYFNEEWELLELRQNFINSKNHLNRPKSFDEMLRLARQLSAEERFIRVDFYEIEGRPMFSEFTFFSDAGYATFTPPEWDRRLGDWLTIGK